MNIGFVFEMEANLIDITGIKNPVLETVKIFYTANWYCKKIHAEKAIDRDKTHSWKSKYKRLTSKLISNRSIEQNT